MAASGSSGSSFTSSLNYPPSYVHSQTSPRGPSWTPTSAQSAVSALTSNSSNPPTPLRPLDLGPPGYQATITLFAGTAEETTVYLGPWELCDGDPRRVVWQCSYEGDVLQHFLPSNIPADVHPHTLHSRHRPYGDPCDMELFLTFGEPHRIRYVTSDGMVVHDEHIEVKYEFTTLDASHRFQGDLRGQDLVDHFDLDVIWSDRDNRTDSFGSVRGIGSIQRLKMWRDRFSTYHYITFYANRIDRRYREYPVSAFGAEPGHRDNSHRRLRVTSRARRGSAPDSQTNGGGSGRRFSIPSLRQRQRSVGGSSSAGSSSRNNQPEAASSSSTAGTLDIRYLGIQFSRNEDFRRFFEQWAIAHTADNEFNGVPMPLRRYELPSPEIYSQDSVELPTVLEPPDDDSDGTP